MIQLLHQQFDPVLHIPRQLRELRAAHHETGWSNFLEQIVHRMTDREFADGFRNAVPIEGADASEYNYRLIETHDLTIASLRFKSLTLTEPFIELLLCDRVLDKQILERIGQIVKQEYSRFQPDRVRYFSANDKPFWEEDEEDFAFFIGNVSEIHKRAKPPRYDDLILKPATSLDFYPRLEKIYDDVNRESGQTLRAEQISSLESSRSQGLLYEAFVDHEWAGVISAHRMTERFYTGIFIVEEAMNAKFRGKGLGSALQRHFIDRLESDVMVFGEILRGNVLSRRTALGTGREKSGTTFFHSIE